MDFVKFLPYPSDDDRIIDQYGVLWVYDARSKTWINMGFLDTYGNVSRESDGLVYPVLFELLESLDPDKFNGLKLLDNTDASFYYLYSSDSSVKFKYVEHLSESRLSMEVNQASVARKFGQFRCQGPKGSQGDEGEQGLPGTPAANELTYKESKLYKRMLQADPQK